MAENKTRHLPPNAALATARYVRMTPMKCRRVIDLVRGMDVEQATDILRFDTHAAAEPIGKVLASAIANAEHDHAMVGDELFVSACYADEGPTLKRWRPRARGRATRIRKRTCHITLLVARLPDRELQERRARRAQGVTGDRRRRRTGGAEAASEQRGRPTRRRPEERTAPETVSAADEATIDEMLTDVPTSTSEAETITVDTVTVDDEATTTEAATPEAGDTTTSTGQSSEEESK